MTDLQLRAEVRSLLGKKTKTLKKSGSVPVVLYGHGVPSRSLSVSANDFVRAYRSAGESTLIELGVGEERPVKVIIQDVQRHPVSGEILHVDFHQVKMTEKLHTEIDLSFVGESVAVKELGGVLVKNLDHVKVEALPGDLVHEIPVDISVLKTFEDLVHIADLKLPNGITVLDAPDDVVCLVTPPRSEAELAALEEKVEEKVEEVEGIEKKEAEEGAVETGAAEGGGALEEKKEEKPKE